MPHRETKVRAGRDTPTLFTPGKHSGQHHRQQSQDSSLSGGSGSPRVISPPIITKSAGSQFYSAIGHERLVGETEGLPNGNGHTSRVGGLSSSHGVTDHTRSRPGREGTQVPHSVDYYGGDLPSGGDNSEAGSSWLSSGIIPPSHKTERATAWWSVGEHMKPRGLRNAHRNVALSLPTSSSQSTTSSLASARIFHHNGETWEARDLLATFNSRDLAVAAALNSGDFFADQHTSTSSQSGMGMSSGTSLGSLMSSVLGNTSDRLRSVATAIAGASSLDPSDPEAWMREDSTRGFLRVHNPSVHQKSDFSVSSTSRSKLNKSLDSVLLPSNSSLDDGEDGEGKLIPCSLGTEAHALCRALGKPANSLHVQLNGDVIRRLDGHERPLLIQNEYLSRIGYHDVGRIQEAGLDTSLQSIIKFYSGKPAADGTFSRIHLSSRADVRFAKMLGRWANRVCSLSGTRLTIYKDTGKHHPVLTAQLAGGSVEETNYKGHGLCLKLTLTSGPEKVVYLAFSSELDFNKWKKRTKKATNKLPKSADLSGCHLEFLPETIFVNEDLLMLNLRHNALRSRPIEEDIYTIGWLEDLPKFQHLQSLNLADNQLVSFPESLCSIPSLVELNLASNRIDSVPSTIAQLKNLQALHLHNNHLSSLPSGMALLRRLVVLVLAFNKFHTVPSAAASLTDVRVSECETLILAGNFVESICTSLLLLLKHAKKIDLRMNSLLLPPSETVNFVHLEHLTHLDLRDNSLSQLDLRCVRTLEYLSCERNSIHTLQLHGGQLKTLLAAKNDLTQLIITPKPQLLETLNLSRNSLERLPVWTGSLSLLKVLDVSHNQLVELPERLFMDALQLRCLSAGHNFLPSIPFLVSPNNLLETVELQHNAISQLPPDFLIKGCRLKLLNVSSNLLVDLPPLSDTEDLNRIQALYLAENRLRDSCMEVISGYTRLRVLHLSYNFLTKLEDRWMMPLEMLQELCVSGNQLQTLPVTVFGLPELRILRAHSNLLKEFPDLSARGAIRVLDVGSNHSLRVGARDLAITRRLTHLDVTETALSMSPEELEHIRNLSFVTAVDTTGRHQKRPDSEVVPPCQGIRCLCSVGRTETSGIRNKMCVATAHDLSFVTPDEALFAMFDGGRSSEVSELAADIFPDLLKEELDKPHQTPAVALRYAFLATHQRLGESGQRLGCSALACFLTPHDSPTPCPPGMMGIGVGGRSPSSYTLHVANCGDVQAILCRAGEAVILSQDHTIGENKEEIARIFRTDGIITEDGKVNGVGTTSRCLGSSFLYPHVLPEPHISKKSLRTEDQYIVIANSSLWRYISPEEVVEELSCPLSPTQAAKRLQDLAQAYGSREGLSALVVSLHSSTRGRYSDSASSSSTSISQSGFDDYHNLADMEDWDCLPSPVSVAYGVEAQALWPKDRSKAPMTKRPIPLPRRPYAAGTDSETDSPCTLPRQKESRRSHHQDPKVTNKKKIHQKNEGCDLPAASLNMAEFDMRVKEQWSQSDTYLMNRGQLDSTTTLTDSQEENHTEQVHVGKHKEGMIYKPSPEDWASSDTCLLNPSSIHISSPNYFNRPRRISNSTVQSATTEVEEGCTDTDDTYHASGDTYRYSNGVESTYSDDYDNVSVNVAGGVGELLVDDANEESRTRNGSYEQLSHTRRGSQESDYENGSVITLIRDSQIPREPAQQAKIPLINGSEAEGEDVVTETDDVSDGSGEGSLIHLPSVGVSLRGGVPPPPPPPTSRDSSLEEKVHQLRNIERDSSPQDGSYFSMSEDEGGGSSSTISFPFTRDSSDASIALSTYTRPTNDTSNSQASHGTPNSTLDMRAPLAFDSMIKGLDNAAQLDEDLLRKGNGTSAATSVRHMVEPHVVTDAKPVVSSFHPGMRSPRIHHKLRHTQDRVGPRANSIGPPLDKVVTSEEEDQVEETLSPNDAGSNNSNNNSVLEETELSTTGHNQNSMAFSENVTDEVAKVKPTLVPRRLFVKKSSSSTSRKYTPVAFHRSKAAVGTFETTQCVDMERDNSMLITVDAIPTVTPTVGGILPIRVCKQPPPVLPKKAPVPLPKPEIPTRLPDLPLCGISADQNITPQYLGKPVEIEVVRSVNGIRKVFDLPLMPTRDSAVRNSPALLTAGSSSYNPSNVPQLSAGPSAPHDSGINTAEVNLKRGSHSYQIPTLPGNQDTSTSELGHSLVNTAEDQGRVSVTSPNALMPARSFVFEKSPIKCSEVWPPHVSPNPQTHFKYEHVGLRSPPPTTPPPPPPPPIPSSERVVPPPLPPLRQPLSPSSVAENVTTRREGPLRLPPPLPKRPDRNGRAVSAGPGRPPINPPDSPSCLSGIPMSLPPARPAKFNTSSLRHLSPSQLEGIGGRVKVTDVEINPTREYEHYPEDTYGVIMNSRSHENGYRSETHAVANAVPSAPGAAPHWTIDHRDAHASGMSCTTCSNDEAEGTSVWSGEVDTYL